MEAGGALVPVPAPGGLLYPYLLGKLFFTEGLSQGTASQALLHLPEQEARLAQTGGSCRVHACVSFLGAPTPACGGMAGRRELVPCPPSLSAGGQGSTRPALAHTPALLTCCCLQMKYLMSKQSHLNPQSNYRNKIRSQTGATLKVAPYLIILSQLFFPLITIYSHSGSRL